MMGLTARSAAAACGGRLVHVGVDGGEAPLGEVNIDSRTLPLGATFVCLRGPRFDGHDFAAQAVEAGATTLLVDERGLQALPSGVRESGAHIICVSDTEQALVAWARACRARFQGPLVGITGSCGKTTTKELLAAVLTTIGPTLKTRGNQNNQLGVPLTLCRLDEGVRAAVVELGTNSPGEIAYLSAMAEPTFGLITAIGAAHLEGLGTVADVALEKGALFRHLPSSGRAFLPESIAFPELVTRGLKCPLVVVGEGPGLGLRYSAPRETVSGVSGIVGLDGAALPTTLRMSGAHNLQNATLAIAVGLELGVSLKDAVSAVASVAPAALRGEVRTLPGGAHVVLDCYNANPESMRAALRAFEQVSRSGVVVLGDMLELGSGALEAHLELGRVVALMPDVRLVAVGPLSRRIADGAAAAGMSASRISAVSDARAAVPVIQEHVEQGSWILLKGSRGMRLEQVYEQLSNRSISHE